MRKQPGKGKHGLNLILPDPRLLWLRWKVAQSAIYKVEPKGVEPSTS
jgi:hypothetical protein